MNKVLLVLIVCVITYSCSSVRLFEVDSLDLSSSGDYFQFDNDTVQIVYNFHSDGGTMSFLILNKLDIPIYVDWRKSSFILNNLKLNYWEDIVETKTIGSNINLSKTPALNSKFWNLSNIGLAAYSSIVTKPERITFAPPSTLIQQSKFVLYSKSFYQFERDPLIKEIEVDQKTICRVNYENYNQLESPIIFRNFLTFSTSEDFKTEFYVDNSFYVDCIKSFKLKFIKLFANPKNFYITTKKKKIDLSDPLYD